MLRTLFNKTTIAAAGLSALGFGAAMFAGSPDTATAAEVMPEPGVTYLVFNGTPEMLDQPVYVLASGTPIGGTAAQLGMNSVPVPTIPGATYMAISETMGPVNAAVVGDGADTWDHGDEL